MHHRMPPSETWWPSLNVVILPPRPGQRKTVATPEFIDQIHELILQDRPISAKSIGEQLGISREWFGPINQEDLDMWMFSAKWYLQCLNADQKCQR